MSEPGSNDAHLTRRRFFSRVARGALGVTAAGVAGVALVKAGARRQVWQIDPFKCVQCGQCRTHCVLENSAVKCVHDFVMCGYCELCTGFFYPDPNALNEGAENQLCPVGAIRVTYVAHVDAERCTGCGICMKNCPQDAIRLSGERAAISGAGRSQQDA